MKDVLEDPGYVSQTLINLALIVLEFSLYNSLYVRMAEELVKKYPQYEHVWVIMFPMFSLHPMKWMWTKPAQTGINISNGVKTES